MAVVPRTAPAPVLPSFGRRIPLMLLAAIILTAVTAMGIGQVMQTSRTATIGYDLRSLERERGQLAAEIRLLEAGIAQTSRIDEVRAAAVERLNDGDCEVDLARFGGGCPPTGRRVRRPAWMPGWPARTCRPASRPSA